MNFKETPDRLCDHCALRGKQGCDMSIRPSDGVCWPESNVPKLKKLAEKIQFPEASSSPDRFHRYKVSQGTCFSWNPFPHEYASCDQFFGSQGTLFDEHTHEEKEFLIVYRGRIEIKIGSGDCLLLGVGDHVVIEPGVPHQVCFLEDCELYAITIPKTSDWGSESDERTRQSRDVS